MVYVLHKFKHFLLGNKFVFYIEHMAFVYLVNKPQMFERMAKWMLFLKYEFTIVYKFSKTHVVTDVLSRLPRQLRTIRSLRLNYRCITIFYQTYVDARSKELFRIRSDARNFDFSSKIKVSQKGRTFYSKRRKSVQSGTRK